MATPTNNQILFLAALRDVLPMLRGQSDSMLESRIGVKRLAIAEADITGFMEAGVSRKLSKNERLALLAQLLKSLTAFMKEELGLAVTIKTLIDSSSLIGEAFERQFPYYLECKMLLYTILPMKALQNDDGRTSNKA